MKKFPKSISKKKLIDVLQKELLLPGTWANNSATVGGKCTVCAVGAVIRSHFGVTDADTITSIAFPLVASGYSSYSKQFSNTNLPQAIQSSIESGGYMTALSGYFEFLGEPLIEKFNRFEDTFYSSKSNNSINWNQECDTKIAKLVTECRRTIVPQLIRMVSEYFPERIPLTERKHQ